MGIVRDSFVILKNWANAIEVLPEEYQLETYKALMSYGLTGQMPENVSAITKALLISFSVSMENNITRYNASVENGKKGGRPKKETEETQENLEKPRKTQENLEKPNPNLNDNVNVNVNDNYIESKKESKEDIFKNHSSSARETYDQIIADMEFSKHVEWKIKEFIKHCLANGHVLINSELEGMLVQLDLAYENDEQRMQVLDDAIKFGYFGLRSRGA